MPHCHNCIPSLFKKSHGLSALVYGEEMVMCIGGKRICLGIVFAKMHRDKMIHLDGVDKLLCAAHIIFTQAGIDGEHMASKCG